MAARYAEDRILSERIEYDQRTTSKEPKSKSDGLKRPEDITYVNESKT